MQASGPWHALCDNEKFLRTRTCGSAHKGAKVKLWGIPAKSPDLNPVEQFWSWLRNRLRAMDLCDAMAKRPVLGKTAFKARSRKLYQPKKAQETAADAAKSLKETCPLVLKNSDAASGR